MPDLLTLTSGGAVQSTDKVLIVRGSQTYNLTVAQLLAGLQAALSLRQGTVLGRAVSGEGVPAAIGLGEGLAFAGGELIANGQDHASLDPLLTMDMNLNFVVNAAGVPRTLTMELLKQALPIPVGDDGLELVDGKMRPVYGRAANTIAEGNDSRFSTADTITISVDTTLTAVTHGGKMLICTNPVVLTALAAGITNGFVCLILNVSGGEVVVVGAIHPSTHTRLANDGIGVVVAGTRDDALYIRWSGNVTQ